MPILPNVSRWSLRKKLVSIIMLGSAVCLMISLTVLGVSSATSRYDESRQQLLGLADVLAENSQAALAFSDQMEAKRLLESLMDRNEISSAWLVEISGIVLASWDRVGLAGDTPAGYQVKSTQLHSDFWSPYAELYQPVIRGDELIGYVLLQADFTAQWNRELTVFGQALIGAAIALLVVFVLAIRLQLVI